MPAKLNQTSAVVNVVSLKQNVRIALIVDQTDPGRVKFATLFSTDLDLDPKTIYQHHPSRFQIEFIPQVPSVQRPPHRYVYFHVWSRPKHD